jgi:uncharacterized membrane protein
MKYYYLYSSTTLFNAKSMKKQFEPEELGKNNPDNYKWGIFYYNPDDTRAIVPKRIRWAGWTLNFASPFSYLIILGIIGFAVLMEYFF